MLKLIAAIGKNRELGQKGDLCFRIKVDMQFFKTTTMGHAVLMGQTTWESIGAKPLPGRKNFVLSRGELDLPAGVTQVHDLTAFLEEWQDSAEICFILGGASVYAQTIDYCKELYLTEIAAACADADVFFPDFDQSAYHKEIVGEGAEDGVNFVFAKYIKL